MGMFGALTGAIKGGLKPGLVKKMLPGMGGQSKPQAGGVPQGTGGMKSQLGGLGPSAQGMAQIGSKMMPPNMGMKPPMMPPMRGPQDPNMPTTGMGINRPPIDPAMVGQGGMPPDMPPEGMMQGPMGPSPQGMAQLLAKMRTRNTGINGKRAMMPNPFG